MMSNKAKCDVDWKTLDDTLILAQGTMGLEVPTPIILVSSNTSVPYRSGRVVIQPNRFMFLEKSFKAISEERT